MIIPISKGKKRGYCSGRSEEKSEESKKGENWKER